MRGMTVKESEPSPGEVRKKLGMSVQEFAAALGVRDYTVERWEKSQSRPSPLAKKAIQLLLDNRTNGTRKEAVPQGARPKSKK